MNLKSVKKIDDVKLAGIELDWIKEDDRRGRLHPRDQVRRQIQRQHQSATSRAG